MRECPLQGMPAHPWAPHSETLEHKLPLRPRGTAVLPPDLLIMPPSHQQSGFKHAYHTQSYAAQCKRRPQLPGAAGVPQRATPASYNEAVPPRPRPGQLGEPQGVCAEKLRNHQRAAGLLVSRRGRAASRDRPLPRCHPVRSCMVNSCLYCNHCPVLPVAPWCVTRETRLCACPTSCTASPQPHAYMSLACAAGSTADVAQLRWQSLRSVATAALPLAITGFWPLLHPTLCSPAATSSACNAAIV